MTETELHEINSLVTAARKMDVASILLHANAIMLQQQQELQQPFFVPTRTGEDKLQVQLIQCREALIQLQHKSSAAAAAAVAVAAAIPGRSLQSRDRRPLLYTEATSEAWTDLLQSIRSICSLHNAMMQLQEPPMSTCAAAAVRELLQDIDTVCRYSRNSKKKKQEYQYEWEQCHHKWSLQEQSHWWQQYQHVQQQEQHQKHHLDLVQKEVKTLHHQLNKWLQHHDTDGEKNTPVAQSAEGVAAAGAAATAKAVTRVLTRQKQPWKRSDSLNDSKESSSINASQVSSDESRSSSGRSFSGSSEKSSSDSKQSRTSRSNSSDTSSSSGVSNDSDTAAHTVCQKSLSNAISASETNKRILTEKAQEAATETAPKMQQHGRKRNGDEGKTG
ncbi:homeotic protein female sterile-like [Cyclospora cayetanensis]|uniref:Homeotic protein female sterile-like n=1 Tax=Cyclospora cayetanensis TaxID=88456 RepID=A0A6P6S213_9EIME|nr:homeotic protein female sterile-like [Cyclospora cayetanensis]